MSEPPLFSIVVPTYSRPRRLSNLLTALAHLRYPFARFEVIIVDDGGSVPIEPAISGFRDRLNLTLLRQENTGPGGARNYGAAHAQGDYLAFTDDDCCPDPGWLEAFAGRFQDSPASICGGRTISAFPNNPYSAASQLLLDYLREHYSPTQKLGGFFATNNFAVPRKTFLDLDGFHPALRFGEDREFCYRWASRGYPFVFAPEAIVYHANELRLCSFLHLHFSYGGGTFQFRRRCAANGLGPVKLSPPSWYLNLVLSGIRAHSSPRGLVLSLLLLATQAACSAGFLWAAATRRGRKS